MKDTKSKSALLAIVTTGFMSFPIAGCRDGDSSHMFIANRSDPSEHMDAHDQDASATNCSAEAGEAGDASRPGDANAQFALFAKNLDEGRFIVDKDPFSITG